MKTKQVTVLKSLLVTEIDYLEQEAIPEETNEEDIKGLKEELAACKDLLVQLNK